MSKTRIGSAEERESRKRQQRVILSRLQHSLIADKPRVFEDLFSRLQFQAIICLQIMTIQEILFFQTDQATLGCNKEQVFCPIEIEALLQWTPQW